MGNYINDNRINVAILTESNVTESKLKKVNLQHFTNTDYSCRVTENIRGGGGGGVLILVHHSIPFLRGYSKITKEENELEHCSTTIF